MEMSLTLAAFFIYYINKPLHFSINTLVDLMEQLHNQMEVNAFPLLMVVHVTREQRPP